jgi:hypothetical protein
MMTYKAAVAFSSVDEITTGGDADDGEGMSFLQKFVIDF